MSPSHWKQGRRKLPWFRSADPSRLWETPRSPARAEAIVLPKATFYLEAPGVTQDLLTIKWTLRAAGYAIGSTWHDSETSTRLLPFQDHWSACCAAQLQLCDALVVLSGKGEEAVRE